MPEKMESIRFAVVGYGHIGKRHAETILKNKEAELAGVCEIKTKAEVGFNLDIPFFSSVDELIESGIEFDVLNVCTPNGLHAEHAIKALDSRKHVVIEKPMALNVEDCRRIIAKRLETSRKVFCVMQNRYSPPSVWIKDVVERN